MGIQNLKFVALPTAKMTARCALYMGTLKESLSTPTATFPKKILMGFFPIEIVNVPTKSQVRSFTRS